MPLPCSSATAPWRRGSSGASGTSRTPQGTSRGSALCSRGRASSGETRSIFGVTKEGAPVLGGSLGQWGLMISSRPLGLTPHAVWRWWGPRRGPQDPMRGSHGAFCSNSDGRSLVDRCGGCQRRLSCQSDVLRALSTASTLASTATRRSQDHGARVWARRGACGGAGRFMRQGLVGRRPHVGFKVRILP